MAARFPHDFWQHRFDGPAGLTVHRDFAWSPQPEDSIMSWREQLSPFADADPTSSPGDFAHADFLEQVDFADDSPAELQPEFENVPAAGDAQYLQVITNTIHPAGEPVGLFVPEQYEARYAYPLVIWLHGAGGSERDLFDVMPTLSTRNYLGLALRGPCASSANGEQPAGFDWDLSPAGIEALLNVVQATACEMRRTFHIHSERIILAGFDRGATAALELLRQRPDWFGGAASVCGKLPETSEPRKPASTSAARSTNAGLTDDDAKRLLLIAGSQDDVVPPTEILQAGRLLDAGRLDLSIHIEDGTHRITAPMLRQIDQWIIDGICQTV